jgi:AraC family transcriptional regulator
MENFGAQANYATRLTRVTSFIYDHLDDHLELQSLADVAALSPFHWHRIYHALYGETVAATVKRLRLQRAGADLARTSMPMKAIAARAGYDSVASFTRVFKSLYGMPPAQYRREGSHAQFEPKAKQKTHEVYDIGLINVPKTALAVVNHVGSYLAIGKAFDALYATLGSRNLISEKMRSIAIYLDDPTSVPEPALRAKAGIVVEADFPVEHPLERAEIRAGAYAVLKHKGPYSDMKAAYDWLFGDWLAQSGREPADAPVIEEYLNSPRDTPPTELRTDIYLPLR